MAHPGVHYDLTVGNGIVAPDGAERNAVLAISSTVTVNNKLTDTSMRASTSINFSGIKQFGRPEFDGQSFVSQCPIAPNSSFTYVLNTSDTAGTLLYRSGLSTQYSDGLRGPLIIYDPEDPHLDLYDVDDESTIIQLGEWYHGPSPPDMQSFRETGHIIIYDSGLINGVGRFVNGPDVPFPVFDVVPGTRYRLRLISNAPRAVFPFRIDQHNLTVIEADGFSVEPTEVESLELYPGKDGADNGIQSCSPPIRLVVSPLKDLRASYQVIKPVDNYWMRAFPRGGTQTNNPNLNATFSRAIVRYLGAPEVDPVTPMVNLTILHDAQLHPVVNPGSPGGPDAVPDLDLFINFTTGATETNPLDTWRVNDIAYVAPTLPTLFQILHNNDSFPVDSHVITVAPNALIQLTMPLGDDDGGHPMHLHGAAFDIIQPGDSGGVVNFVNPVRRDIVPIIGGTAIARFRMPAVGILHLHCHIIWHAEAASDFLIGLQLTFVTDPDGIRAAVNPRGDWDDLCPAYFALPPELQ
ncbi:laccase [Hymenopellis radicata]|nr:laccase [Hymenopellis radicata]